MTVDLWTPEGYGEFASIWQPGPAPVPAPTTQSIGWFDPVDDSIYGAADILSEGTNPLSLGSTAIYAGIVGDYVPTTVVWSLDWTPSVDASAPFLAYPSLGIVSLAIIDDVYDTDDTGGTGILSAIIDGVAAENTLTLTVLDSTSYTWGPT